MLAVLVASEFDADLELFDIEPDAELQQVIIEAVARFKTDHLDTNIMPDFEPQRDAELIKALYHRGNGSAIDLRTNNAVGQLVDAWQEQTKDMTRLKKYQDSTKAELQALLGEHTYAQLADGRVLQWKNEPRKGYAVAATNPRVLRLIKHMPKADSEDDAEDASSLPLARG